jgi:colanic acid biosynthesis glycosyl transferase WcaI
MHVLIVSQHFPPDPPGTGRRAMDFAEELTGRGHRVTVLTGMPHHPSSRSIPAASAVRPGRARESGYNVWRIGVWKTKWAGLGQRALTYGSFVMGALWRGIRLAGRADVVVAISPLPTGLLGMIAARARGKPFIFDLQDIWPESGRVCGMLRDSLLFRALQLLERFVYRRCAAISVITPGFGRYLESCGIPAGRIAVLHNGIEVGLFKDGKVEHRFLAEHDLEGKFVVLYFGNVGLAQNLRTLLEAAERLQDEPDVQFVIMGDGVDKANLIRFVQERKLANCRFVPTQPRGQLPGIVAGAQALVVMLRRSELFTITIPSKLYECLAAGKPIICTVPGDAAAIVNEAGTGLVVPPDDPVAVADAIRRIRKNYPDFLEHAHRARAYVLRRYSRDAIGAEFEALCQSVTPGGRSVETAHAPRGN